VNWSVFREKQDDAIATNSYPLFTSGQSSRMLRSSA